MTDTARHKVWQQGVSAERLNSLVWEMESAIRTTKLSTGPLCDELGTLLAHFGRPEARTWLLRAVEAYRAITPGRHSVKTALTLWKAGERDDMQRECTAIREEGVRSSVDSSSSDRAAQRRVRMALEASAEAEFLLGRYAEAATTFGALDGLRAKHGVESGARDVAKGVVLLCGGILQADAREFADGLELLCDEIDDWPTLRCSLREDLFRFALALPICDSEAFIRRKMDGGAPSAPS